jgi:hypothetical protein
VSPLYVKADEDSDFVCVRLIEQEPSIYDKSHPDYARRDKVHLASEKNSHKMNGSDMCVNVRRQVKKYPHTYFNVLWVGGTAFCARMPKASPPSPRFRAFRDSDHSD